MAAVRTHDRITVAHLWTPEKTLEENATFKIGLNQACILTGMTKSSRTNVGMHIVGSLMMFPALINALMQIIMSSFVHEGFMIFG